MGIGFPVQSQRRAGNHLTPILGQQAGKKMTNELFQYIDWADLVLDSPFSSWNRTASRKCAVFHYTASPHPGDRIGESDIARVRRWLEPDVTKNPRKSSTHLVIMRGGQLIQGVPLSKTAWHAGGSEWLSPEGNKLPRVNRFSIGIDFDNVGPLRKVGRGKFVDYYGGTYKGPAPVYRSGGYWEPYTDEALETGTKLLSELVSIYPVLGENPEYALVGHCHVSPTRKVDPGPVFPWELFYETAKMAR